MLGLRTKNGFNLESCTIDFNNHQKKVFLNKIDKLLKENLIFKKNNDIFMNPEKWLLSELASRELFTLGK